MPDALSSASPVVPARGALLGFDFGLVRIGVAVGEFETRIANPLTTLTEESNDARFAAIARLIDEWQPIMLVTGIPAHLDGEDHELTRRCQRFANQLRGRFGLPVAECDERLSSATAESELRSLGQRDWRKRKPLLDAAAARIILQHYLDGLPNEPTRC